MPLRHHRSQHPGPELGHHLLSHLAEAFNIGIPVGLLRHSGGCMLCGLVGIRPR
jgi:hypothetical protein